MSEELEYRTAEHGVEIVDVSFPKRTVELIVMPYEQEAQVAYRGRMIKEICSRGAYDGIEERNGEIKVNLHHDVRETCGRAVRFHPSRQEGLVAELYISKADPGEKALTMADEGLLDASAGFCLLFDKRTGKPYPDAERWETRDRRRLNKLWLGHIALTPEPAYAGAEVLSVRSASAAVVRPNIERLELEQLREQVAVIDARYGVKQH